MFLKVEKHATFKEKENQTTSCLNVSLCTVQTHSMSSKAFCPAKQGTRHTAES